MGNTVGKQFDTIAFEVSCAAASCLGVVASAAGAAMAVGGAIVLGGATTGLGLIGGAGLVVGAGIALGVGHWTVQNSVKVGEKIYYVLKAIGGSKYLRSVASKKQQAEVYKQAGFQKLAMLLEDEIKVQTKEYEQMYMDGQTKGGFLTSQEVADVCQKNLNFYKEFTAAAEGVVKEAKLNPKDDMILHTMKTTFSEKMRENIDFFESAIKESDLPQWNSMKEQVGYNSSDPEVICKNHGEHTPHDGGKCTCHLCPN